MSLTTELRRSFFSKKDQLGEKVYLSALRLLWLVKTREMRLLVLRCLPTNAEYRYVVWAARRKAKFDAKYYGFGPKKKARLVKHRVKEARRSVYSMIASCVALLSPKIKNYKGSEDPAVVSSAAWDFMQALHQEFLKD